MHHFGERRYKTYGLLATFALAAALLQPYPVLAQDQDLLDLPKPEAQPQVEHVEEAPTDETPLASPESENTSAEPEVQGLEVSQPLADPAVRAPGAVREISSFADLIPYLSVRPLPSRTFESHDRLVLEAGHYRLTKDIEISLEDPYFADKKELIEHGIFTVIGSLTFDGNNHTIKFPDQKARGLFGSLGSSENPAKPDPRITVIQNLTLDFSGDVLGFPFAEQIRGYQAPNSEGFPATKSLLKNITVKVAGNVDPIPSHGLVRTDNHFVNGNFLANMATGFSWYLSAISAEDIAINVSGNIGSATASDAEVNYGGKMAPLSAASYGFSAHYSRNLPNKEDPSYQKLKSQYKGNNNPAPLRDTGYIQNLTLNVGGNIQATSNNLAYAAGLSNDITDAWVDNAQITINGDIAAVMNTDFQHPWKTEDPYAYGIGDGTGILLNSSLSVNNIRLSSPASLNGNASPAPKNNIALIGLIGYDDNHGYYTNISHNTFTVKDSVTATTGLHLMAHLGHGMHWNSHGKDGMDWVVANKDNNYSVNKVELTGTANAQIIYEALGEKTRTGERTDASLPKLPEAALENTTLKVGELKVSNPKGHAWVALGQNNIAGAKNNSLTYGDVSVDVNIIYDFLGLGGLRNEEPATNVYDPITENNNLQTGDITVTANDASYVSLMFGHQPADHIARNNTVQAKSFTLNINDPAAKLQPLISGISSYAEGELTGNRLYVGDFTVNSKSTKKAWISPGIAFAKGAKITDNSVFVDKNISIGHGGEAITGGFLGRATNTTVTGSSFQLGGIQDTSGKVFYGAFAGQLADGSTVSSSSALNLNDFAPFVYQNVSSTLDGVALYNNAALPDNLPALQVFGSTKSVIKNSTLLVPAKDADSPLYFANHVIPDDSVNNYVVAVNNKNGEPNRIAYSAATEKTVQIGEQELKVIARAADAEPVGSINIAERSFQDKYWTTDVSAYQTGPAEASFTYMNKNSTGATVKAFLVDKKLVSENGEKGKLPDYFHRHAGLLVAGGPVYDLLGIPVVDTSPTPTPTPTPIPQPGPLPQQPGGLARTGMTHTYSALLLGLFAIAAGTGLVLRRRGFND